MRVIKGDVVRFDILRAIRNAKRMVANISADYAKISTNLEKEKKRLDKRIQEAQAKVDRLQNLHESARREGRLMHLRTRKEWKAFEREYDDGCFHRYRD